MLIREIISFLANGKKRNLVPTFVINLFNITSLFLSRVIILNNLKIK